MLQRLGEHITNYLERAARAEQHSSRGLNCSCELGSISRISDRQLGSTKTNVHVVVIC
jgi:hypothetical protein